MTNRDALEQTIASDPVLSEPAHSATVALVRSLADQLDAQGDTPQARTLATYAGLLGNLRRIIRDAQAERAKQTTAKPASRLALIKDAAANATSQKGPE